MFIDRGLIKMFKGQRSKPSAFNMFNPTFGLFPKSSNSFVQSFPAGGTTMNKDHQLTMDQMNTDGMPQQVLNTENHANGYGKSRDDFGVGQQAISPQQRFVAEFLGDDIKIAINSYLPMPYTSDSPEVRQFYQQLIAIIGTAFKNQVREIRAYLQ